jgi:nitrate/nitrite transporter NarK
VSQPSIIRALGYASWEAQLLTVPPYALATILTLVYAIVSERYGIRAPFIILSSATGIVGYIMLLANTNPTAHPGVSYAGVFFAAAGIYPSVALGLSWPAMNVSGQTKRAAANGLQITIGNLGAVIGTQLYRANDGPRYIVGHSVALAYLCANIVVVSTLWLVLSRINRKRDEEAARNPQVLEGEWKGDTDPRWRFRV